MHDPRIELVEIAMADIAIASSQPIRMELLARVAISVLDAYDAGYNKALEDDEEDEETCTCDDDKSSWDRFAEVTGFATTVDWLENIIPSERDSDDETDGTS